MAEPQPSTPEEEVIALITRLMAKHPGEDMTFIRRRAEEELLTREHDQIRKARLAREHLAFPGI